MFADASYEVGDLVVLSRDLRNDGSHSGLARGEVMLAKGAVGEVIEVGLHLNRTLIYRTHFGSAGLTIGCRDDELAPATACLQRALASGGQTLAASGQQVVVIHACEGGWRIAINDEMTVVVPPSALSWPQADG